jgi:uroporphyrinogen decarboxylase
MKATNAVSNYNIVHLCGWIGVQNNMDVWDDYEGAVIHWDQHTDRMPIEEAQVIFKNRRALMAGFDNKPGTFFYTADKADVKAVAKNYARQGGKTGFILSSDCSLVESFPYERICWVGEALEELAAD